jgi:antitoxin ParD1/3/4
MRTNIDIDDQLMDAALRAGPYKTKREAVEAGLALVARQAVYREVLKWRGKLRWDGDDLVSAAPSSGLETATRKAATVVAKKAKPSAVARSAAVKATRASKARGQR